MFAAPILLTRRHGFGPHSYQWCTSPNAARATPEQTQEVVDWMRNVDAAVPLIIREWMDEISTKSGFKLALPVAHPSVGYIPWYFLNRPNQPQTYSGGDELLYLIVDYTTLALEDFPNDDGANFAINFDTAEEVVSGSDH